MNGTLSLAIAIHKEYEINPEVYERVNNSPEPLRAMVYGALGSQIGNAIDGTELYHEIVDHLENIY